MRKIAVFTGNRAEYSMLNHFIRKLQSDTELDSALIVSGAHLDKNFGYSLDEIKRDNHRVDYLVPIDNVSDGLSALPKAIAQGITAISQCLELCKPDIVLISADRYESFAAMIAATQMGIPVAHHEGGEVTQGGTFDDSVRHAMSMLAHLHFTTNDKARERLLKMGEEPWRVFTVGSALYDYIRDGELPSRQEIEERFQISFDLPLVILTLHPVAIELDNLEYQVKSCLGALGSLDPAIQIIVTYPNNDIGGEAIINYYKKYASQMSNNIIFKSYLGAKYYLGILSQALDPNVQVACVGNSSSGVKDTPFFKCPSVNIGDRQSGRLRGENVLDCDFNEMDIRAAIQKAVYDGDFRKKCLSATNPYGDISPSDEMLRILKTIDIGPKLLQKKTTL